MMKQILTILFIAFYLSGTRAGIVTIPENYSLIQDGINAAETGDTVLILPGTYHENIVLQKEVVIASRFIFTGDSADISGTIIDGQAKDYVFYVANPKDGQSAIIGLTIKNGDDGIMASAPLALLNNLIIENNDGIDYETGSGGICKNNVFRNNTDDGIDLDGTLYHMHIENNAIYNNDDDGIEIRLHSYTGEPSIATIINNKIFGNGEDGIQFIDYADTTKRTYRLERNLIYNNAMAGIGCMDKGDTKEDYRGAAIPEPIYVFNNTISGHTYGICGGGNMVAVNNVIINSSAFGAFNITEKSTMTHNLFYANAVDYENCHINAEALFTVDPMLDEAFVPAENSPCIDKGLKAYITRGDTLLWLKETDYSGTAVDLGAIEADRNTALQEGKMDCTLLPNPFSDYITILTTSPYHQTSACLFNAYGSIVAQFKVENNMTQISTSDYPKGIYFIHVVNTFGDKVFKIIKS